MAKALMIQGTTSNAGKSFLTAGFCRIFRQMGYRTAPFKSQNMALNSFVTRDGLEMGRAQVMQAAAAGLEPDIRMNPILLKPQSDTGSQVIVNGEVRGVMKAAEYYRRKTELIPDILKAYQSLAAEFDIIVLEGAGSPAEINLRENDIVNMGMARMAKAPVLLAGDIDRGGVFASLYGTSALLLPEDRKYLKATIINKFRGDPDILRPGLRELEQLTGVPVAGVVPYLRVDLDDEDSLSERLERRETGGWCDIAVIRLPRLSNFTDFNGLSAVDGVSIRYVSAPGQLGNPDCILLPGTKNTMGDLKFLRESGLETLILRHAERGGLVIGICGGYQMLGESLSDPEGIEEGGTMRGMGLLPVRTVFEGSKVRTRASGTFLPQDGSFQPFSGRNWEGYEIHMGRTEPTGRASALTEWNGARAGTVCGNVMGCYFHGLFDTAEAAGALLETICRKKGLDSSAVHPIDLKSYQEKQYDLLADGIRNHVDMDLILKILEQGVEE